MRITARAVDFNLILAIAASDSLVRSVFNSWMNAGGLRFAVEPSVGLLAAVQWVTHTFRPSVGNAQLLLLLLLLLLSWRDLTALSVTSYVSSTRTPVLDFISTKRALSCFVNDTQNVDFRPYQFNGYFVAEIAYMISFSASIHTHGRKQDFSVNGWQPFLISRGA